MSKIDPELQALGFLTIEDDDKKEFTAPFERILEHRDKAFTTEERRQVAQAIVALRSAGKSVDAFAVQEELAGEKFKAARKLLLSGFPESAGQGAAESAATMVWTRYLEREIDEGAKDAKAKARKGGGFRAVCDAFTAKAAEIPFGAEKRKHVEEWTLDELLRPIDYGENLLGNRFLERGGIVAMVAPSGVGKSVACLQMSINFACGREAFHIKPDRPLRVLVIENEDTLNDCKSPVQGVWASLSLPDEEADRVRENLRVVKVVGVRGKRAADDFKSLVKEHESDLVFINPLLSYCPGKQGEETEVFIRESLLPLAHETKTGLFLIHHTPKIGRQNGVGTGGNEYERQYDAAGKADVVNALRGIINIQPCGNRVFRFTADKRGDKIGWTWDSEPTKERYFQHSSAPDDPEKIWWRDASPEDVEKAKEGEDCTVLLKILPAPGEEGFSRERIIHLAKEKLSIGKSKTEGFIKMGLEDGVIDRLEARTESGRKSALFRASRRADAA